MTDTDERTATPTPSTEGDAVAATTADEKKNHLAVPDGQEGPAALAPSTTHGSNAEPKYVTGVKLWLVVLALSLAFFIMMLDMSIVATAIPRITNEFHSLNDVGWYGAAYQLACAPMQPLSGKIYTYFKTKWAFLIYLFIFELGSLICGVAQSSTMLIVGRAVAGLGGAGIQNGTLTILAGLAPLARRAFLTGIVLGIAQLGVVAGPLLGGVFTEFATWRWCFYVNLPVGAVVASLILLIHIPEQTEKMPWRGQSKEAIRRQLRLVLLHRMDLVGFFVFSGATIQLLLALQWGGTVAHPWNSSVIIGLFVGAGVTALLWGAWNYRMSHWLGSDDIPNRNGEAALVPTPIARERTVYSGSFASFTLMGTIIMNAFFIAIYFQTARDASPVLSGVNILPNILSQLFFAVASSTAISKMGYYLPWAFAGTILNSIGTGLLSTLSPTTPTGHWIGFQILAGAGRGMVFQAPILAIQHAVQPNQISVAVGLFSFGQNVGGAVLLTIANTVFDNSLKSQLRQHAPGVNPEAVIAAGATAFRAVVPVASVPGVILAYANSVDRVFYFAAALSVLTFFSTFGLGWKDIRVKKGPSTTAGAEVSPAKTDIEVAAKAADDNVEGLAEDAPEAARDTKGEDRV
ncbi:MFS transporter [Sporothrix schenckii 1099-18]|uniref:MFS transporter n=1 Tax=Sporothrix schenckii 1099-18 TaxID=1397361 RepID=A0A0F2MKE0_SPOSC|nr:MFS transporter [Sporothrix schenckii 1099-18]KJR89519.1 MFS transporter [Sporothrix schenckii 1099-18]